MAPEFCPQCGTARVGQFRFCRSCQFDFDTLTPPAHISDSAASSDPPLREQPESVPEQRDEQTVVTPVPIAPVTDVVTAPGAAASPWQPPEPKRRTWVRWAVIGVVVILILGAIGSLAPKEKPDTGTAALSNATPTPTFTPTARPTATPTLAPEITAAPQAAATPEATPVPEPTPAPTVGSIYPKSYAKLSDRDWARVVKAPDNYVGKGYKVWACITQFDAATGLGSFRGQASNAKEEFWFSDGSNAFFEGSEDGLADFVQNDIVAMDVVAEGSYSYDTQNGGNTTVPMFLVMKISRQGDCSI